MAMDYLTLSHVLNQCEEHRLRFNRTARGVCRLDLTLLCC